MGRLRVGITIEMTGSAAGKASGGLAIVGSWFRCRLDYDAGARSMQRLFLNKFAMHRKEPRQIISICNSFMFGNITSAQDYHYFKYDPTAKYQLGLAVSP